LPPTQANPKEDIQSAASAIIRSQTESSTFGENKLEIHEESLFTG